MTQSSEMDTDSDSDDTVIGDALEDTNAPNVLAGKTVQNIAWVEKTYERWLRAKIFKSYLPELFARTICLRSLLDHFLKKVVSLLNS